jgi:hypothetical protein
MLPTEDLFVYVYVLVDDAISSRAVAIAARPGPAPACTDAELLAVALVRHLLGRRSEAGFLAEVARDWAHCSRGCRTKARRTGGSAGCGARLSSSGRCWQPGCPTMTASRSIPPRCRSSTPPGSAARRLDRAGQRPGRPVRPRRRARRMVLRLPAGHQGRPRLAGRPGLEHRARRGQRARGRRRPAPGRAATP